MARPTSQNADFVVTAIMQPNNATQIHSVIVSDRFAPMRSTRCP